MEIPGGWGGGLMQKYPPWRGMEYFLELHFTNIYKFFQFFRKRQLLFLNENKIAFKQKFTKLETILTLITLAHPKFSQKREREKRKEMKGRRREKVLNYNKSP